MMKRILHFLLIAISITFATETCLAGGLTSNGGDWLTIENNPWFITKKPNNERLFDGAKEISWCVVYGRLSISRGHAVNEIKRALQDWSRTILGLRFQSQDEGRNTVLNANFHYVSECSKGIDLTFYLGALPRHYQNQFMESRDDSNSLLVRQGQRRVIRKSLAFAQMTHWNPFSETARGFIWLTSDLKHTFEELPLGFWNEHAMFSVILHELGHVFGLSHDFDGIMNREFPMLAAKRSLLWKKLVKTGAKPLGFFNANFPEFRKFTTRTNEGTSKVFTTLDLVGLNPTSRVLLEMTSWPGAPNNSGCTFYELPHKHVSEKSSPPYHSDSNAYEFSVHLIREINHRQSVKDRSPVADEPTNILAKILDLGKRPPDLYKICYQLGPIGWGSLSVQAMHSHFEDIFEFEIVDSGTQETFKSISGEYMIDGQPQTIKLERWPYINMTGFSSIKGQVYHLSFNGFNNRRFTIISSEDIHSQGGYNFTPWAGVPE